MALPWASANWDRGIVGGRARGGTLCEALPPFGPGIRVPNKGLCQVLGTWSPEHSNGLSHAHAGLPGGTLCGRCPPGSLGAIAGKGSGDPTVPRTPIARKAEAWAGPTCDQPVGGDLRRPRTWLLVSPPGHRVRFRWLQAQVPGDSGRSWSCPEGRAWRAQERGRAPGARFRPSVEQGVAAGEDAAEPALPACGKAAGEACASAGQRGAHGAGLRCRGDGGKWGAARGSSRAGTRGLAARGSRCFPGAGECGGRGVPGRRLRDRLPRAPGPRGARRVCAAAQRGFPACGGAARPCR